MTIEEIVRIHLDVSQVPCSDYVVQSTLDVIVQNMRSTAVNTHTSTFAPSLCAFAVFDQIGGCYELKSRPATSGIPIGRALQALTSLQVNDADIDALYAFRNGIVHDASFTSQSRRTGQWYRFKFDRRATSIIVHAQKPWTGDLSDTGTNTITYIGSQFLRDAAEEAIRTVRDKVRDDWNDLDPKQSRDEILKKYLVWLPIPPKPSADTARKT